ncbi:MAG: hypothetical protein M0004_13735 [Actinomycetota bacterium]|nr:hypothetical protein [Actinomycetota bacterium]
MSTVPPRACGEVCSDAAEVVIVTGLDGDQATGIDPAGVTICFAAELVAPLALGARVLVHAGAAIGRIA